VSFRNLDSSIIVNNVACFIDSVPSSTYSSAGLVSELTFLVLLDDCLSVPVEVKVASDQVRVEIVLFNIERGRYFTLVVELTFLEHGASVQIIDHIS